MIRGTALGAALVLAAAAHAATPVAAQDTHLIIVTGLGGTAEYTQRFAEWGGRMAEAAVGVQGVPAENVRWLAERENIGRRVAGVARRDAVLAEIAALGERSAAGDVVAIILFGHGTARGDEARVNLPGPDLTAEELAVALEPLADRRVVVVNTASASGGFVGPLAAPGRVVITATRNTRENEATEFGEHFVAAFAGEGADTDKDGAVSFLEAFEYARAEVARDFEEAGHLATEHALLEDDGDGQGSMEPAAVGSDGDGRLARALTLAPATPAAAAADEALRELYAAKARLEAELERLRARQAEMEPAAYQAELERLLLEIAANGRAIREREGGAGGGGDA